MVTPRPQSTMKFWPIRSGRRNTVLVQEDIDDINSASRDSLSPDLGEVWRVIVPDNISEKKKGPPPFPHSRLRRAFEYHEHKVWNSMLGALCHFEVGVVLGALLDEVAVGRIAVACHFSLDLLCGKTSSLPIVNDHVSGRNWPPSPYLHVATESANVLSLSAAHEPALMQYVLDGSTWSSICPFLDLFDTFNMRTTATTWNSEAKYPGGALLFFLLHNAFGHSVNENVQVCFFWCALCFFWVCFFFVCVCLFVCVPLFFLAGVCPLFGEVCVFSFGRGRVWCASMNSSIIQSHLCPKSSHCHQRHLHTSFSDF